MAIDSVENFIANYERLKSSRKMAEYYSCSKTTILNYAKKIGYNNLSNKEKKITCYPIEEVYEQYQKLGSYKAVGEYYNCSATAVQNYLKSQGYKSLQHGKLDGVLPDQFVHDYTILQSAEKMGEKYNCSGTAILQYAHKIGYNPSDNKEYKLSEQDKQDIINNYNTSTSTELAQKYNVSRGMITKIWYDNNLSGKTVINSKTTEINLINQQFGKWTVIKKTEQRTTAGNIMWLCRCECGIEREVSSLSLRQGVSLSCGSHSNISKGNEKIKNILMQAGIPFVTEKKFPTCIDKKELPFDFYVQDQYLIEYDGIQHFQETIFDYEYAHKHDLIKNQWCKEHNIPLIRIPYTAFDNLQLKDLQLKTTSFLIE